MLAVDALALVIRCLQLFGMPTVDNTVSLLPMHSTILKPSKDKGEVTGTTYRLESVNKDDDVRIPSGASVSTQKYLYIKNV